MKKTIIVNDCAKSIIEKTNLDIEFEKVETKSIKEAELIDDESQALSKEIENKISFLFNSKLLNDIKFNIEVNCNANLMSYDMRASENEIPLQLPYVAACMMLRQWFKGLLEVNPQLNQEGFNKIVSIISEIETLRYNLWNDLYNELTTPV